MLTKQIKSLQHPFVKKVVKIRKSKDFRDKEKQVLVIGKKIVLEIAKKHSPSAILSVDDDPDMTIFDCQVYLTSQIMNKIAGLNTQEKIAALFPMPDKKEISNEQFILTLDGVSDPGNLGTLFRSALALKFDAILLLENTVDPFNDKAIRASKGACFFLPFYEMTKKEFIDLLNKKDITPYIADMKGIDIKKVKTRKPFTLILNNETKGKGSWPENFVNVAILMSKDSESLNVATSGSILMYVMRNE